MIWMLVDILVLGIAAYLTAKPSSDFETAIYLGKKYPRELELVNGEVTQIKISTDGNNLCKVFIPDNYGYADLKLNPDIADKIAEQKLELERLNASERASENEPFIKNRVKVVLLSMALPHSEYVVKAPNGNQIFLTDAKLGDSKEKRYTVDEAATIEDKIKAITYNRNALLMVGCIFLFFNSIISFVCGIISIALTLTNKEYGDFTDSRKDDIIWTKVEQGKESIKKVSKKEPEITVAPTKAEKIIMEAKSAQESSPFFCEKCGTVLSESDYVFCPYCGNAISKETDETIEESPFLSAEDISFLEESFTDELDGEPYEDIDLNAKFELEFGYMDVPENGGIDGNEDDSQFQQTEKFETIEQEDILNAKDLVDVQPMKQSIIGIDDFDVL